MYSYPGPVIMRPDDICRTTVNNHWKLYYWIRGQPFDDLNDIVIPSDATIKSFKRLITQQSVAESRSNDSPPPIHVYKVPDNRPIPFDESLSDILGSFSTSTLGNSLLSVQELSNVFATPPLSSRLHLIVDVAPFLVRCWVRGAEIGSFFEVKCSKLDRIGALKSAIKEKETTFTNISESRLKLYNISTTDGELADIIDKNGKGKHLIADEPLGKIFSDIPFSRTPFVVVDLADERPGNQIAMQANTNMYHLTNIKGGTTLDLSGADNISITGFGHHGGTNQTWIFESAGGDRTFHLKSLHNGKYLSVSGVPRDGAKVIAAELPYPWHIEDEAGVDGGVKLLSASNRNFCLDLSGHGNPMPRTPVELWGRWGGKNQVWKLRRTK